MSGEISQEEYQSLASFRHAVRRFLRFSEEAARSVGLTPRQHQALLAIKGGSPKGRITVGELAKLLVSRPHTASELVDRLEAHGLILREHGPRDARQVYLSLTEPAEKLLAQLSSTHRDELRRMGPELVSLLRRLNQESGE